MYRHALVALFGLWLPACFLQGTKPPDGLRAAEVAVCASQAPLVSEALVRGGVVLEELKSHLQGALERLRAGEMPTPAQQEAIAKALAAVRELQECL